MNFVLVLPTISRVQFFETQLDSYQIRITQSYNLTLDRWQMNIENLTLETKVFGIVMNQGVDLLNAANSLNLQALVLVNQTQIVGLEANESQLGVELVLAYMDLETYEEFKLDGAIQGRSVYRVPQIPHA